MVFCIRIVWTGHTGYGRGGFADGLWHRRSLLALRRKRRCLSSPGVLKSFIRLEEPSFKSLPSFLFPKIPPSLCWQVDSLRHVTRSSFEHRLTLLAPFHVPHRSMM